MAEDSALGCGWVVGGESWCSLRSPPFVSVVPVSLLVSMVWRVSTRTVDCCLEHERQTSNLLGPPRGGRFGWLREGVSDRPARARPVCGLGDQVAGLDASDQDSGLGGGEVPF